jgi:spore germination protein YaaH
LSRPHINAKLAARVSTDSVLDPPPQGQRQAAWAVKPLVPSGSGPSREVFGFVQASVLADPSVGYPSWDFSMLSTVAYFGEHVNWDGHLVNDSGYSIWNSNTVNGLINTAHSQGVKVVLTLIMMDGASNQNAMCSALGSRDITISEAISQMKSKQADGINIDYEGDNAVCQAPSANGATTQSMLIDFVKAFRNALNVQAPGSYLSIDSYSGSGQGPDGFFNLPALAPWVDSFFVMAYDMEYYNWYGPPANCSRMCLGPTAPLTTYGLNDTRTATEYSATIPASKVILGMPYYGRKACVAIGSANDYPTSAIQADGYQDAASEQPYVDTVPNTYSIHRDPYDAAGQERFDDWQSVKYNCTRQLYWDDFVSLGAKYDLVNRANLRGVGLFTLNYGGGSPELWCDLRDHFSAGHVPATATVSATQTTTSFTVGYSAGQGCGVSAFDVQVQDMAPGQPWLDIAVNKAPTSYINQTYSGMLTSDGYRGHTYQYRVRTRDGQGNIGAWSPFVQTTVSTTATLSRPFAGLYTLDAYGGVGADGSAPAAVTAYWQGWKIAKSAHALPGPNAPQGGLTLDGYGGLHAYGQGVANVATTAYWNNYDIARDFAFLPDGSGGYVLDGLGGLHPFSVNDGAAPVSRDPLRTNGMPRATVGGPFWPTLDVARKVVIFPNGSGGYILDGYGHVHGFGIGRPAPPDPVTTGYWPSWDIAHDFALIPGTQSGYVMDGYGGLHPFAPPGQPMPPALTSSYWPNWDIARGIWFLPTATLAAPKGYLLDGYGGLSGIGGAPGISPTAYYGFDVARNIWGA